ncbi:hypothetical protein Taro_031105 [Colocasia esculenta]|uniref:Signal recognition particle subunit SRP68 n=1 Tax=Colocasia esculenta TaxID=4460 RepID=A0A843VVU4_COLES|nr:hypothetical protein [Colocasia esculenta]
MEIDQKESDSQEQIGPKFSINVLQLLKSAQLQHGLRHRDYTRYRRYCSARLRRLYKSLKFTHGRGKYARRAISESTITDVRFLHVVLYMAERAWSHAMEKRSLPDGPNSRQRIYLLGRLRKAVKWATLFAQLCAIKGDRRTSLEAEAFMAEERSQQAVTMTEFNWLGHRFPINNAKTRVSILKARELEKDLHGSVADTLTPDRRLSLFEKIFTAYQDARSCIRNDLNTTDLSDLVSSGRESNPEEVAFSDECILKGLTFRAERCFYLAKSYSLAGKRAEAYALYCHSRSLADSAIQKLQTTKNHGKALINDLKALIDDCRTNSCIEHAAGIMEEEKAPEELSQGVSSIALAKKGKKIEGFLLERLNVYESALGDPNSKEIPHIERFPPPFQAVPCNPIVLDIVFNSIEFPSLENRMKKDKKEIGCQKILKKKEFRCRDLNPGRLGESQIS